MRKKCSIILFGLTLWLSLGAWVTPPSSYYVMDADTVVYLPKSANGCLTLSEDGYYPINISGSNITGYITYNNVDYSVYFRPYQQPYFTTSQTYHYITFDPDTFDTNILMLDEYNVKQFDYNYIFIGFVCLDLFLDLIRFVPVGKTKRKE